MSIPVSDLSPVKVLLIEVAVDNYTYDFLELGSCVSAIVLAENDRAALLAAEDHDVRLKDADRAEIMEK